MTLPAWARSARYLALTTFRRTGVPVTTPVWFVVEGDSLLAQTEAHSGKAKRLAHTSRVEITPCTFRGRATGPTTAATARLEPARGDHVLALERARYGLEYVLLEDLRTLPARLRDRKDPVVGVVITPG